jgi:predicted MFS family arabinose efflux permease
MHSGSILAHPWRSTACSFFVNGSIFGVWATQIPLAKARLDINPSVLGLLLLTIGIGALTAMSAGGLIIRRFGSAAVIRWAGLGFCLLLPLTSLATSPSVLAIVLFCFGAAGGSMDVAMNAHAAEVERRAKRPWMSSFHGMWSLGGLGGSAVGGLLLSVLTGPQQTTLVAVLAVTLLWRAQRSFLPHTPPADPTQRESLKPELRTLLIGILTALCFGTEGAILDWSSVYLGGELGAKPELAGLGFAAFSCTMALGRFVGDRVRRRMGPTVLLRGSMAIAMVGLLLGPLSGSVPLAILGFLLTGVGLSNVVPVLINAAGAARHPNTAIALTATIGYGGLLAAPPLLGFIANTTSLAVTFEVVAGLCLVIGLSARVIRPSDSK